MYQNILLAVDGSEHSLRAAHEASQIAALSKGCSIELVYVVDFAKSKAEVLHAISKEELEQTRRQRLLPVEELLRSRKLAHRTVILHGDPGPAIVDHANQNDFDLLVIGSSGLNVLQEMVLGSVSHKVVKRAKCPVLVVK